MLLSRRMSSAAPRSITLSVGLLAIVLAVICSASASLLFAQPPAQGPTIPPSRGVMRKLIPIDQKGTIPYFIADGFNPSGHIPSDTELVVWAFEEWERAAKNIHFTRSEDQGRSLVRLHWVPPKRGRGGLTHALMENGRPIANIFVSANMGQFRGLERATKTDPLLRDTIIYFLSLHEIGQTRQHTREHPHVGMAVRRRQEIRCCPLRAVAPSAAERGITSSLSVWRGTATPQLPHESERESANTHDCYSAQQHRQQNRL
jgi:hypothetical protein